MNIKSILLGSAAALVAVSGARAADAVVMVEPEPVEYVRVCDVYGAGFFYIPGTETCLRIGGYVRMRVQANDSSSNFDADFDSDDDYQAYTRVRARLNFDVREETELGTLRGFIRVQAQNSGGGDDDYNMDQAYIQLGGLTMGYLDSLWATGDGFYTDNDLSVGDFNQNQIGYTFSSNGFTAAISLEDDASFDAVPDVIGKVAYEGAWGGAYLMGVFDEQNDADFEYDSFGFNPFTGAATIINGTGFDGNDRDDSAFALKAAVELKNLIAEDSAFKIEGSYAFDPTVYTAPNNLLFGNTDIGLVAGLSGDGLLLSSEWQIGAGYTQTFGKVTLGLSGVYGETFDIEDTFVNGLGVDQGFNFGSAEYYGLVANVGYEITKNFEVLGQLAYSDIDAPSGLSDGDETSGFIQFQRNF